MGDTDTRMDPRIGSSIAGRYLLEERIASGGMATVYKARDTSLGRDVAIKIMHPALGRDATFASRFRAEAQNAARLSHPNIVTVYDTGESDGDLFIVMELCGGITLRALLERFGYLDPPTVRHVARGIAAALDHAHMKGIVHRDVKPENVILTPDGQVKVVDFGIAKALGPQSTQLTTDRPIGTIAYVSPEQLSGTDVDGRADVYALGAVTYEMLTGNAPFRGDSPQAVAAARMQSPVLSPGISPSVDGAVMRATAARPQDRFETPGEFARALGDSGTPTFLMDTDHLPDVPATGSAASARPGTPPSRQDPPPFTDVLPLQERLHRRSRRRFKVRAAIAFLLVIGAIAAYAVMPKPATVPDLRGQSLAAARNEIRRDGLRVGDVSRVYSDSVPAGSVVGTDPPIHTAIKKGTVVDLSVSKGAQLFDVPTVVGKPVDEAKALMSEIGFSIVIGETTYNDTVPKGNVADVTPDIDRAKRGTAFTATVSNGPPPVTVPNVNGKSASQAEAAIETQGLVYAASEDYSDTVATGVVISTDPAGGASAPKGSTVTAHVSKGPRPFPMPNLVGMSLAAAKAKASSLGLVVKNEYAVPGSGKPKGQVQGQNPPSGTNVRKGAAIDLYYSA